MSKYLAPLLIGDTGISKQILLIERELVEHHKRFLPSTLPSTKFVEVQRKGVAYRMYNPCSVLLNISQLLLLVCTCRNTHTVPYWLSFQA